MTLLLNACSFGHRNFDTATGPFREPDGFVLQIDDSGWFWDPQVAGRALDTITKESGRTNTIVVLFVHGWHHNAAADDENARDFAKSLVTIREKLTQPLYRQSREKLTGHGDVRVIGIYVGWRGKSLPMPLDYATFWGRKAAAERVGEGDLREFLLRLNGIYYQRSTAREGSRTAPFMGLVSIGHSFGGQVLFRVVSSAIEKELIEATPSIPNSEGRKTKVRKPVQGFGDITVLINPALEALQYHRIHQLNSQLEYNRRQTPLLLVMSAENDLARKLAFPVGRWLGVLVRASFRDDQAELWRRALGEYEPQRTHEVEIVSEPNNFDPTDYVEHPCRIVNADLTDVPTIGGVRLKPLEGRRQPFSPFVVAYASPGVILRHSGIFEQSLRNFLNDYVAILEGKKMLLGGPENFGQTCAPAEPTG